MERRRANIIFSKNGNGFLSNKITLPVPWVNALNFSNEDKTAIIEFCDDKIIIKKETINMLLIKKSGVKYDYEIYEYELENGLLLNSSDWNGEAYIRAFDPKKGEYNNNSFKAVYRFQEENIDIDEIEENSPEWDRAVEIVGFMEI